LETQVIKTRSVGTENSNVFHIKTMNRSKIIVIFIH
jgi:hypothetical protein